MRHLGINYFATAHLNDIIFIIFLPLNSGHLVSCTFDNVGTILFSQTTTPV